MIVVEAPFDGTSTGGAFLLEEDVQQSSIRSHHIVLQQIIGDSEQNVVLGATSREAAEWVSHSR